MGLQARREELRIVRPAPTTSNKATRSTHRYHDTTTDKHTVEVVRIVVLGGEESREFDWVLVMNTRCSLTNTGKVVLATHMTVERVFSFGIFGF